jgi:hypothetical protein
VAEHYGGPRPQHHYPHRVLTAAELCPACADDADRATWHAEDQPSYSQIHRELDDARVGDIILPFITDGDDGDVANMNLSAIIRRRVHRVLAQRGVDTNG